MMINFDRHFYLYAKNWYKQENTIEDLKKICSIRCGIDVEHIRVRDIIVVLLNLVQLHTTDISSFVEYISPNYWPMNYANDRGQYNFNLAVIGKCLSVLALAKTTDILFDLGEPDSKILPLREKE